MPVALITGCSTGLGLATAIHLGRRGYTTYATMRNLDKAGPLRDAIAAESLPVSVLQLDVTEPESVRRAIADVLSEAGHIDVVVNNAALGPLGPLEFSGDEVFRGAFETNVFGAMRVIREVLPHMRERRSGTIVNVTSLAGRLAMFINGVYSSTKYALEALSEVLAQEVLEFGIRVAIIEPGFFSTPMPDTARTTIANDESSPYYRLERVMRMQYDAGVAGASDPFLCAEVIEHAITTDSPKLRYGAGPDAVDPTATRAAISDEDLIRVARPMSDEEYFAEVTKLFGG